MNFKKYHVSKNLWNSGDVTVALYESYKPIPVSLEQGTYTLSFEYESENTGTVTVIFYNESTAIQSFNVTITNGKGNVSITSEQPITIIRLYSAAGYTPSYNYAAEYTKIMLNTGSTPLPYEPYSSEVWHDTPHYVHSTSTDIITTPADIYANDTTATVGLKGDMSQSSTPTPQNPIQPNETGDRTGNILDFNKLKTAPSGSIPGTNPFTFDHLLAIEAAPNTTYTMSATGTGAEYGDANVNRSLYFCGTDTIRTVFSGHDVTYTTSSDGMLYVGFISSRANAQQYLNGTAVTAINSGSTALPYEPFGVKIPISSANTTTPVYLGEVQTTRRIKKLVLTGEENWTYRSGDPDNVFFMYLPTAKTGEVAMSNAYPYYSGTDFVDMNDKEFAIIRSNLAIRNSDYQYESQFKAYLAQQYAAGTPVYVWYVLANETTGIVNEPLCKIGDYADEVSGITIPTIAGANTIDIDTTLKPSEVTVNYHGWHPVADVHEADNGAWT